MYLGRELDRQRAAFMYSLVLVLGMCSVKESIGTLLTLVQGE